MMRNKKVLLVMTFISLCSSTSLGAWTEFFYEDFDDWGDFSGFPYDGWTATSITGEPSENPNLALSPEGYAIEGTGGQSEWISHTLPLLSNVSELKYEMRAITGTTGYNSAQVYLVNEDDYYAGIYHGEYNPRARFTSYVDGVENTYMFEIDAEVWHDFSWIRDANGWWSINMDGVPLATNFFQDNQVTSFDRVSMHVLGEESKIERIGISIPEPGIVLLLGFGAVILRRRCC